MTLPSGESNPTAKPRSWRTILIAVFAGIGFFVVACCVIAAFIKTPSGTTTSNPTVVPTQNAADDGVAPVSTAAPQPTAEPAQPTAVPATATAEPVAVVPGMSRQAPAALASEYRGNTWAAIVTNVERGASANKQIAAANMFNDAPPAGFEYVLVTIQLTNISTENKAEETMMALDVKMTGSSNRLYGSVAVPPKQFEGALFPNGSIEGQKAFMIPSDEQNVMIVMQESFSIKGPMYLAVDENASITPNRGDAIPDTADGLTRDAPAALNTTVIVNPIAITVNEVVRGVDAANMVKQANKFNDPAPAGTEYVCIRVTLKYLGDTDPDSTYNTLFANNEWRIIGSKNILYEAPIIVEPDPQFSGMHTASIYAGAEISGWIVRSVATDDTNLVLQYQPTFDLMNAHTRYIALP